MQCGSLSNLLSEWLWGGLSLAGCQVPTEVPYHTPLSMTGGGENKKGKSSGSRLCHFNKAKGQVTYTEAEGNTRFYSLFPTSNPFLGSFSIHRGCSGILVVSREYSVSFFFLASHAGNTPLILRTPSLLARWECWKGGFGVVSALLSTTKTPSSFPKQSTEQWELPWGKWAASQPRHKYRADFVCPTLMWKLPFIVSGNPGH